MTVALAGNPLRPASGGLAANGLGRHMRPWRAAWFARCPGASGPFGRILDVAAGLGPWPQHLSRQVIGKLDADAPLSCHDPHFKWRRARRKAIPEHDNQCPLVKSRNIAELQHLAMTRRVGESGFLLARPRGFESLTFAFGGGSSTLI